MDGDAVAEDHNCEIGRWLYGEGSKHRELPEYQHARDLHAAVHRRAAKVVNLVERGRRLEAAADLASGGELRALSGSLAQAFNRLNKRLMETERGSLSA